MLLSLLLAGLGAAAASGAATGLTAEIYANSVMRGAPVCTRVVPNGASFASPEELCPGWNGIFMPGQLSIRLTGTLTAEGAAKWHRFTTTVGPTALVRLWVDDHRIVDAWARHRAASGALADAGAADVAPAGYALWEHANIPAQHSEFPNGKVSNPKSAQDCAARCDELKSSCIGFVATPAEGAPTACYMRKLVDPGTGAKATCATAIKTAGTFSVYTRNSSCAFPQGWKPAGPAIAPSPPVLPDSPATPALLPNVTMGSDRPVFIRVDLRPVIDPDDSTPTPITLALNYTTDPTAETTLIPNSALSPNVSTAQLKRRQLQETAGSGWNHWARRSQLDQIALPQQVGVQLGIQNASGAQYKYALPEPQKTQVRM